MLLTVNGTETDQKVSFKYLGSWITADGRSSKDIKCRSGLERKTSGVSFGHEES